MRILTVIAGILICATGVFCFAVYINPFSDVAFLVGVVMILAGIMQTVSYLISGRGEKRLTDTALVEGLVTLMYGFAVINDQVTDNILTMFFGTWLTLCGITRISQSLYISRFNRKDWAKVMPLGIVAAVLGVIMMMPRLMNTVMPLMLLGGAFVINGFSILVYAMFMRRRDADKSKAELDARQRAEARKALKKAEREQREKLRSMSRKEREEARAKMEADRKLLEETQRQELEARKKARREAVQQNSTIHLSKEEVEEIKQAAPKEQLDADVVAAAALEASSRVSLKLPEEIPVVKVGIPEPENKGSAAKDEIKVQAVNLEEIEKEPELDLPEVELPKVELASEKAGKVSRDKVISEIESAQPYSDMETPDYTPIDFDELVSEPFKKEEDEKDKKRFTQVLNFNWKDAE